ncbi:glycoside hydrolase family 18 protein [Glaciecola sp. 1036]|uniref:glycoside hydrolase family 18 protein n=1 Tax=Alteromonadaceae TaxID=72275 RepID=UPI003D01A960
MLKAISSFSSIYFLCLFILLSTLVKAEQVIHPVNMPKIVGYYPAWEAERGYTVKDMVERGAADKLTHLLFAFAGVNEQGQCYIADPQASMKKAYNSHESLDGVADNEDAPVKGVIGQFVRLKKQYPDLKILWSVGGWGLSPGFVEAAKNIEAFADSCFNMIYDPRWNGVFDGIDIDWEYPNACGVVCDHSGRDGYYKLMKAVRTRFGNDALVTTAIGAQSTVLNAVDYGKAAPFIDFYMPMTYDFSGTWEAQGPVYPHSPLFAVEGADPTRNSDHAIKTLLSQNVPADKILLGIGFYGRGWQGVKNESVLSIATAPAQGKNEVGAENYNTLIARCSNIDEITGTAYSFCNNEWWSFDTPKTISIKMDYVNERQLGGAFFWQLSGDTKTNDLLNAIHQGLN